MAFGSKPAQPAPPANTEAPFVVTLHLGSGELDVQMTTENLDAGPNAIWAILATKLKNDTINGLKTADGRDVIVNWSQIAAVTYKNPW
ncbi:hypothetical protein ACGGZK_18130 [Agromyces sp. MMS24-K17]|uniref:hypothetical protein n=1 Tax=Agromyces sp. MMS24-K17 TaxID=3372850 RepID=UPI0037543B8B